MLWFEKKLPDPFKVVEKTAPLFELCGAADDINDNYFLFPNKFSARFYEVREAARKVKLHKNI